MHLLFRTFIIAVLVGWIGGWPVFLFVFSRRDRRDLTALLDLFDAGTAEMSGNRLIPGRNGIVGIFQGKPASISTQHGVVSDVQVCVSGHFRMPFEVQVKSPPKLDTIRKGLKPLLELLAPSFYAVWFLNMLQTGISFGKLFAAVFLFFITFGLLIRGYSKWMGYDEAQPVDSTWEVPFPGGPPLVYTTYSPTRFRVMIERSEIQDAVSRLIGTRQAYLLRSAGQPGIFRRFRFEGWNGSVETHRFYRRKFLQRDAVRQVLTELSNLCANMEQIRRSNDVLEAARPALNNASTALT